MKLVVMILLIVLLMGAAGLADAEPIKYALSMFHFNIQYVCGGLEGFLPFFPPIPSWEINAEEVEDQIVVESFEPILDLFAAHPDWTVTLEMQGYFLDVLAQRHPGVLDKLRTLAKNGGAEVVSFHYSDQLFLAYPYEDWRRSVQWTMEVFDQYDIPLSGTVFCQEGQAGPAMAEAMETYGYEVMVWPTNLWSHQVGEFTAAPYYTFGNLKMIVGAKGVVDGDVEVTWTFFDDGEKLATGDLDPYFPWFFKHRPDSVAAYETKLQGLVDSDWVIGSVGDYIQALVDAGVEPAQPPSLMGGTWQPNSTDGTHRWMGGKGLIWVKQERDNYVRTLGALAHREMVAAQTAAQAAGLDEQDALDEAWRLVALGQVTDATGINPFRGEIEYGIAHLGEAMRIAREVIGRAKQALDADQLKIDVAAGTATEGTPPENPAPMTAPIAIETRARAREVTEQWFAVSDDPFVARLEVTFSAKEADAFWDIEVTFPGEAGPIEYSPALADDTILSLDRSTFVFDHFYLPLANGLIGLGGDLYVIKDQAYVHCAAQISPDDPDVAFRDETAAWNESHRHVYYLVEGKQAALDFANNLNVSPTLYR